MTIPIDKKEQAIYHAVLSELHRLHALTLNAQTLDTPSTEQSLHEYFTRQQSGVLGKLNEWRNRRPDIYRQASEDFARQIRRVPGS
ncbi:MAG TPA: hypothetical protein VF898_00910 [Chloroflexota bacterium]